MELRDDVPLLGLVAFFGPASRRSLEYKNFPTTVRIVPKMIQPSRRMARVSMAEPVGSCMQIKSSSRSAIAACGEGQPMFLPVRQRFIQILEDEMIHKNQNLVKKVMRAAHYLSPIEPAECCSESESVEEVIR